MKSFMRTAARKLPVRRLVAILALAAIVPLHALAADPYRATSHHSFDDVAKWRKIFEDPERAAWQKPEEVLSVLALESGDRVADLGAGTGFFLPHLSRAVGADGTVFAADVEPNLVAHLRDRAEKEDLDNVVPVLASLDDSRLPTGALDLVLVVDVFHHIDHRLEYLKDLRRVLRDGGRVAIIDWKPGDLPEGPPEPEHKLPPDQVVKEMIAAGYRLTAEHELLPYQYFLVFE